jgi:hypothetical protein
MKHWRDGSRAESGGVRGRERSAAGRGLRCGERSSQQGEEGSVLVIVGNGVGATPPMIP